MIGAACLVIVGLTHVAEAFQLLPWMGWGLEHSVGHYIDLWGAIIGVALFPVGYLLSVISEEYGFGAKL